MTGAPEVGHKSEICVIRETEAERYDEDGFLVDEEEDVSPQRSRPQRRTIEEIAAAYAMSVPSEQHDIDLKRVAWCSDQNETPEQRTRRQRIEEHGKALEQGAALFGQRGAQI